jgi:hypothetical protein
MAGRVTIINGEVVPVVVAREHKAGNFSNPYLPSPRDSQGADGGRASSGPSSYLSAISQSPFGLPSTINVAGREVPLAVIVLVFFLFLFLFGVKALLMSLAISCLFYYLVKSNQNSTATSLNSTPSSNQNTNNRNSFALFSFLSQSPSSSSSSSPSISSSSGSNLSGRRLGGIRTIADLPQTRSS